MKANSLRKYESSLPQAILFDWDNTLVDSWKTSYHVFNKILDYYGRPPFTPEQFLKKPQLSVRDSFPFLFGDNWKEVQRIYYKTYEAIHLKFLTPLVGVEKLLSYLYKNKVYMALVSNKNGDILRKEVEFLNWKSYFNKIIGSNDAESDKPSCLPVKLALDSIQIECSQDILFVGDSMVDVECARNSGCVPVIIGSLQPIYGSTHDLKNFLDFKAFGKYLGME
jgi:phosphoglycolate phosphatase